MPPRVYSPLAPRRLTHPMAVPATSEHSPIGTSSSRRGSPLSLLKRWRHPRL